MLINAIRSHLAEYGIVAGVGRREAETRSVTLRERDGTQSSIPLDQIGEVLAARWN
jgi:hypothetical protein